jgi:hypothetical protein
MKFHVISPEVAGGWGENTVVADRAVHPPVLSKLHYEFDGWLGDVLLTSFPVFIVSESARRKLEAIGATGVKFDDMEVTVSEQFRDIYPDRELPRFFWLKIDGIAGKHDFGIVPICDLVISERVLHALRSLGISHAEIEDFPKDEPSEPQPLAR